MEFGICDRSNFGIWDRSQPSWMFHKDLGSVRSFVGIWDRSLAQRRLSRRVRASAPRRLGQGQAEGQAFGQAEGQGEGQGGAGIRGRRAASQDGEGPIEIHRSFRTKKPRIQEPNEPRNQGASNPRCKEPETKDPRSQEPKELRNQETKEPGTQYLQSFPMKHIRTIFYFSNSKT